MVWLYLSATLLLVGALSINAQLEQRARRTRKGDAEQTAGPF